MDDTLSLDLWADVVCPFCCLGRRQLETALGRFAHAEQVRVRHHAFELDPSAPRVFETPVVEMLAEKYSTSHEQITSMHARLEAQAAEHGMSWSLASAQPGNTFDAHRLVKLAETQGRGPDVLDALYAAHFEQARCVGERATLLAIAEDLGVQGAARTLDGADFADEVRDDEALAARLGLRGVPALVLDNAFLVSGAQGVEAYLAALERAWDHRGD